VVIADEAHRNQYDFIDGYARHMRDALPHCAGVGVLQFNRCAGEANEGRALVVEHNGVRVQ
jgi:hypothetical protein